jgi:hypothetical protein
MPIRLKDEDYLVDCLMLKAIIAQMAALRTVSMTPRGA